MGPLVSFPLLELPKSYQVVIPGNYESESYRYRYRFCFYGFDLSREVVANTG